MKKRELIVSCLVVGMIVVANWHATSAAPEPELIITWKASTYVPADYRGKIIPTSRSNVVAAVELLDSGTLVNISKQTIYWYLDDEFLSGGAGGQSVRLLTGNVPGGTHTLRAQIPNYKNRTLVKSVEIPISSPEAVIEAPIAGNFLSAPQLTVRGLPYFFNVRRPEQLLFSWSVNGQAPPNAENSQELAVTVGSAARSGKTFAIKLTVQSQQNILEAARTTKFYTVR